MCLVLNGRRRRSFNIKKQLFLDANILDEYVLWRLSIIGYPCSFLLGVISSTFYIKSKQATNFVNSITVCYTLEILFAINLLY